jgi:hypothetical protein
MALNRADRSSPAARTLQFRPFGPSNIDYLRKGPCFRKPGSVVSRNLLSPS